MAHVIASDRAKKNNIKIIKYEKYKNKNKMCRGRGNLLYLLCLISNTMSQLDQSSLQPSTDLQHRHLLQTTSYNHLLLLHLRISRKGKRKQQQGRTPPPPLAGGLRSQKGLRPFNPLQRIYKKVNVIERKVRYMHNLYMFVKFRNTRNS